MGALWLVLGLWIAVNAAFVIVRLEAARQARSFKSQTKLFHSFSTRLLNRQLVC
jgi:hypothetical protein